MIFREHYGCRSTHCTHANPAPNGCSFRLTMCWLSNAACDRRHPLSSWWGTWPPMILLHRSLRLLLHFSSWPRDSICMHCTQLMFIIVIIFVKYNYSKMSYFFLSIAHLKIKIPFDTKPAKLPSQHAQSWPKSTSKIIIASIHSPIFWLTEDKRIVFLPILKFLSPMPELFERLK